MTIKWDSRFNVNHPVVDAEHKLLLLAINGLEMSLRHTEDKELLLFFIDQLHEAAIMHFQHEEALQRKHLFPFREENAKGHERLILELNRIRDEIYQIMQHAVLSETQIQSLHNHVSYISKDWLLIHILKEDIKMKGFMGHEGEA